MICLEGLRHEQTRDSLASSVGRSCCCSRGGRVYVQLGRRGPTSSSSLTMASASVIDTSSASAPATASSPAEVSTPASSKCRHPRRLCQVRWTPQRRKQSTARQSKQRGSTFGRFTNLSFVLTGGTGKWPITATSNWTVTWASNTGVTGTIALNSMSNDQFDVEEYRIVLVQGPGG